MIFSFQSELFQNVKNAMAFLLENQIIESKKECTRCMGTMFPKIYTQNGKERIIYRCSARNCQNKKSLFNTKIPINNYMFLLYCLVVNLSYSQIKCMNDNVNNETIFTARERLRKVFNTINKQTKICLGGIGRVVEADETVISRRGIIRNPTKLDDEIKDTIWIFGAIDDSPEKNFILKRVKNRETVTLTKALEGFIGVGSKLCTDGHPSYPGVCENLCLKHKFVNHSEGFINDEGVHTNNIEGFWSYLKSEMRKQHGIKRQNIDIWLDEFTFRKRFLGNYEPEIVSEVFIKILKVFFQ
ncbi:hypothetical protein EQH57_0326 [Dictyocoela roeselum]|nr:hypothetical protein EQH57_0326 [Dictyocoela roeselum]